jgi:uncharacterized protein DUF2779
LSHRERGRTDLPDGDRLYRHVFCLLRPWRLPRAGAHADISQKVSALSPEIPAWADAARATLSGGEPRIAPGVQCHEPFECPFLAHCALREEGAKGYPPEDLPRARVLATELRLEGYTDLRQVPAERLSKPLQRRVRQAAVTGSAELDLEVSRFLLAQAYPRRYLDFETVNFAVPIWADTRPYATQIPFQWSCHVEAAPGNVTHRAFLLPLARAHYYHAKMHGSWSLKALLPTIAPELAYEDLEVADGGMAQEAFREMTHPDTSVERSAALRRALLMYCERDTRGLVRLARYFAGTTWFA